MQITSFIVGCFDSKESYPVKIEVFEADKNTLTKARDFLTTRVSDPHLRGDMIQYSRMERAGGDLYLSVPHTGYAYYYNVTDAFLN